MLIRLPENPSTGYQWQIAGAKNQFVEFLDFGQNV
ncbi:protease inhibitor I42 family protein [Desulfonema ishimotonii]